MDDAERLHREIRAVVDATEVEWVSISQRQVEQMTTRLAELMDGEHPDGLTEAVKVIDPWLTTLQPELRDVEIAWSRDSVGELLDAIEVVLRASPLRTAPALTIGEAMEVYEADPDAEGADALLEALAASVLAAVVVLGYRITMSMPADERLTYWYQIIGLPLVVWALSQLRQPR